MAIELEFNNRTIKKITKAMQRPLDRSKTFLSILGSMIDSDVQAIFRGLGVRPGAGRKWDGYMQSTIKTKAGKFKRRPGTDNAKTRKYSGTSKMLQASGGFRKSFKTISVSPNKLVYGTRLSLKGKDISAAIMSDPERQVLFVSNQDIARYGSVYRRFFNKEIKFV